MFEVQMLSNMNFITSLIISIRYKKPKNTEDRQCQKWPAANRK